MLLALETVFDKCSVCLFDGGVVASTHEYAERMQTQRILPMIKAVLNDHSMQLSQLEAIAFNRGPGSFSGVRINTTVAQALAWAYDIGCAPVSGLQAHAYAAFSAYPDIDVINVCLDARMNEVYFAVFWRDEHGLPVLAPSITDARMVDEESSAERLLGYQVSLNLVLKAAADGKCYAIGDGVERLSQWDDYSEFHVQREKIGLQISAEHIAALGWLLKQNDDLVEPGLAQPSYLRNHAWKTLAEQAASKQSV